MWKNIYQIHYCHVWVTFKSFFKEETTEITISQIMGKTRPVNNLQFIRTSLLLSNKMD
jgi:hypothetical protein